VSQTLRKLLRTASLQSSKGFLIEINNMNSVNTNGDLGFKDSAHELNIVMVWQHDLGEMCLQVDQLNNTVALREELANFFAD
jgi:hypothetical protein